MHKNFISSAVLTTFIIAALIASGGSPAEQYMTDYGYGYGYGYAPTPAPTINAPHYSGGSSGGYYSERPRPTPNVTATENESLIFIPENNQTYSINPENLIINPARQTATPTPDNTPIRVKITGFEVSIGAAMILSIFVLLKRKKS